MASDNETCEQYVQAVLDEGRRQRRLLEESADQLEKHGEIEAAELLRLEAMDSAVADFFPPADYAR